MMIKLSLLVQAYLENDSVFILSLSLIYLNEAIIMWLSLLMSQFLWLGFTIKA